MKNSIFIILLVLSQSTIFAQSRADYEQVMDKFKNFYNTNHGDSISGMFYQPTGVFNQGAVESILKHQGRIRSLQYMGIDPSDSTTLFKTTVVKYVEPRAIGLRIDSNSKIITFHLFPSSPYIDSLLATR